MLLPIQNDPESLPTQLHKLRTRYYRAIRQGAPFPVVKEIHLQIKKLEDELNYPDMPVRNTWGKSRLANSAYGNNWQHVNRKYKHINEPPPLL